MKFIDKIKSLFGAGKESQPVSKDPVPDENCTGVVKYFNRSRGYGFIHSKDLDSRVFLHISEVDEMVRKGQKVRFQLEETDRGLKATNVEVTQA